MKFCLLVLFFTSTVCSYGQKKDSLKLICPLNEAVVPPAEKQPYSLGVEELKIVLKSPSDTTVKACMAGTITNVMRDDDGTFMVMFNNKDYYFLYSGITRTKLHKGDRVQNGGAMGYLKPGEKLEFQIYDFETALDPKNYLDCLK